MLGCKLTSRTGQLRGSTPKDNACRVGPIEEHSISDICSVHPQEPVFRKLRKDTGTKGIGEEIVCREKWTTIVAILQKTCTAAFSLSLAFGLEALAHSSRVSPNRLAMLPLSDIIGSLT
jgi:hypothetical protein